VWIFPLFQLINKQPGVVVWNRVQAASAASARNGHAVVTFGASLFMFGGF